MKKNIIMMLLALACAGNVFAQNVQEGIVFYDNENWNTILDQAKAEDKLIFIDCYTTWCGPCKALAKDIFPQKKVGDFFNPNFICVKYDMEKGDGKMLNEKYKKHILGYPTLLIINKDGEVKQQMAGYKEADELIEGARQALRGRDLFTLQKEYQAGKRDIAFLSEYMGSLNTAFMKKDAQKVAEDFLKTMDPKELDKDEVWNTFGEYVTDVKSPVFAHMVENVGRYSYRLKRDRTAINRQIESACSRELNSIFDLKADKENHFPPLSADTAWAADVIRMMEKANVPGSDKFRLRLAIHKALLNGNNENAWNIIKVATKAQVSGFYSFKVDDYVNYLMPLTSNKKVLKDYLDMLGSCMTGKKTDALNIYKTMSLLYAKLGNKKQSAELMTRYEEESERARKEFEEFFKKKE